MRISTKLYKAVLYFNINVKITKIAKSSEWDKEPEYIFTQSDVYELLKSINSIAPN